MDWPVYRDRPVEFCEEILGVRLWSKQREILGSVLEHERTAVRSGNGIGKGFTAAAAILWWARTHSPCTVITTAPTSRQVRYVLWRQLRQTYLGAREFLGGTLYSTRWDVAEGQYALGITADEADSFQGFHSPNLLVVVDEASGVEEPIYEAIDSMATAGNPRILLIGNPTQTSGGFHRAFHRERRLYTGIAVSALESPNLTGEGEYPGLVTQQWVDERAEVWGEDSPMYLSRVMGEFPEQGENALLALKDIESNVRGEDKGETPIDWPVVIGVDVARFGSDSSCICVRYGQNIRELEVIHGLDTMQLTGRVIAKYREHPECGTIAVDEIGIGGGVVDRLREQGLPVKGINVARASYSELCANRRAEGYWQLRTLLRDGELTIPNQLRLLGELADLRYQYTSEGKILMESKDAMRARGGASPDVADAVMLSVLRQPSVRLHTGGEVEVAEGPVVVESRRYEMG